NPRPVPRSQLSTLRPGEFDTSQERYSVNNAEASAELRRRDRVALRYMRKGRHRGEEFRSMVKTFDRDIDDHVTPSSLPERPLAEQVDAYRQRQLREFMSIVEACKERGVVFSERLCRRVFLHPADRTRKQIGQQVAPLGSNPSELPSSAVLPPGQRATLAAAAGGRRGGDPGAVGVTGGGAVGSGAPWWRQGGGSGGGGGGGGGGRASNMARLRRALPTQRDLLVDDDDAEVELPTGTAMVRRKVDCWLTFEEFQRLTDKIDYSRQAHLRGPRKDAFWPGRLEGRVRRFLESGLDGASAYGPQLMFQATQPARGGRSHPYLPKESWPVVGGHVDEEIREFLEAEVNRNPFLTLSEMAQRVNNHFFDKLDISYRSVDRILQGLMYTVKLATKGTDVRSRTNSQENIEARVTTQRGPNVIVCMAIADEFGLVHSSVFRGGQTNARFQIFIDELNCGFVACPRIPQHLQHAVSIRILLGYSPFLNPSEFANSCLKAKIKSRLAQPDIVEEEAVAPEGMNQEEWRYMLLERVARESLPEAVTPDKAAAYITRFTEESFASLIALIFIIEAFKKLSNILKAYPVNSDWHPTYTPSLTCTCELKPGFNRSQPLSQGQHLRIPSYYDSDGLYYVNHSAIPYYDWGWYENKKLCSSHDGQWVGSGCNQFAVPDVFFFSCLLSIGIFVLSYGLKLMRNSPFFPNRVRALISDFTVMLAIVAMTVLDLLVGLQTPKLHVPETFSPTLGYETWGWIITAVIVNRKENKLKKGLGYHLDLLIMALLIGINSILGIPWFVAATVLSINHAIALKIESETSAPGERPKFLGCRLVNASPVGLREPSHRLPDLLAHRPVGFLTPVLKHIPMPVLYGVFLFMGISSLRGVQLVQRVGLMFMPQKYQPDYIFLRHVRIAQVHKFTIIQVACLAMLWAVKAISQISILFPIMVLAMCFVRWALNYMFTRHELKWLDDIMPPITLCQSCKPGSASESNNSAVVELQMQSSSFDNEQAKVHPPSYSGLKKPIGVTFNVSDEIAQVGGKRADSEGKGYVKKVDNSKQTGAAGGKAAELSDADEIVLQSTGRESPVTQGLRVTESTVLKDTPSCAATSASASGMSLSAPSAVQSRSTPSMLQLLTGDVNEQDLQDLLDGNGNGTASFPSTPKRQISSGGSMDRKVLKRKDELLLEHLELKNKKLKMEMALIQYELITSLKKGNELIASRKVLLNAIHTNRNVLNFSEILQNCTVINGTLLRDRLRQLGLPSGGRKRELQVRLEQASFSNQAKRRGRPTATHSSEIDRVSTSSSDDDEEATLDEAGAPQGTDDLDKRIARQEKLLRLRTLQRQTAEIEAELENKPCQQSRKLRSPLPIDRSPAAYEPELGLPDLGPQGLYSTSARPSGPSKPLLVKDFINRDGEEPASGEKSRVRTEQISAGSLVTVKDGAVDLEQLKAYVRYCVQFGEFMHQGFSQAALNCYDEDFRILQHQSSGSWERESLQLLSKHILAPKSNQGGNAISQRTNFKPSRPKQQPSGFVGPIDPEGRELCVKFNRNGCLRRDCKFRHIAAGRGAQLAAQLPRRSQSRTPAAPGWPCPKPLESVAFSSDLATAAWEAELTDDPDREFLLNGIRNGFQLTCPDPSERASTMSEIQNYLSVNSYRQLVEQQVREEILNGRYVQVSDKPEVISALGAIPKGNNKIRLIHDCSNPPGLSLNSRFSSDYRIKFETVSHFTAKLQPGWFMAKVDLANAYRSVGISPHDFRLTGLKWKFSDQRSDSYICDTRLPFGAAASVEVFHRLSQAVKRMMQRRGFNDIGSYLDDFAIAASSKDDCQLALDTLLNLLRKLGFSINWSKVVAPCTRLVYLGVLIDTVSGLLELPKDKLDATKSQLQSALSRKRITKRQLQSLCGRINWVCQVVRIGRCFLRPLLLELSDLKQQRHKLRVHNDLREILSWWDACLAASPSCKIWRSNGPSWAIESDASNWGGCGIIRGPDITSWLIMDWHRDSTEIEPLHINFKESLAPVLTALHFQQQLQPGSQLVIYSDSTAAVGAINKGSSPNRVVNSALQQLMLLAAHRDLSVQAFHVPGTFQIFADSGSRADDISELTNFLLRLFGSVHVDLSNLREHTLSPATCEFLALQIARLKSRARTSASATASSATWPSLRHRALLPLPDRLLEAVLQADAHRQHQTVAHYIIALSDRLSSHASVGAYINAADLHCKLKTGRGLPRDPRIDLLLRGVQRKLAKPPARKAPITPGDLLKLRGTLRLQQPQDAAFWAAVLVGFWGLLRRANLCCSKPFPPAGEAVTCGDLQVSPDLAILHIRRSKTNQFRQRVHRVVLPRLRHAAQHPLCPVAALLHHLRINQPDRAAAAHLFAYRSSGGLTPLTGTRFCRLFQHVVHRAGLADRSLSPHSLRRGGASLAFRAGVPLPVVKALGDWRSSAVEVYLGLEKGFDSSWRLFANCLNAYNFSFACSGLKLSTGQSTV
uniref:HTH OST-type domain-containing protein n=1 Tax=Macrostomum lignano TaxID=282301 RepID=A0A1I8H434_9PLAT